MPASPTKPSGQYKWDLGNAELEKCVSGLEIIHSLDESAKCVISLSLPYKKLKTLSFDKVPQEASFTWTGKTLFKGRLVSTRIAEPATLILEYRDALFKSYKIHENAWLKGKQIGDLLKDLARRSGLNPSLKGSFSDTVPAFNPQGKSLAEIFSALSDEYGFHFFCPAGEADALFLKLGEGRRDAKIDLKQGFSGLVTSDSVEALYGELQLRGLERESLNTEDSPLKGTPMFQGLGALKESGTFRQKERNSLAKGVFSGSISEAGDLTAARTRLSNKLSKRALGMGTTALQIFEPAAGVGDLVSLSNSPYANFTDGKYLVKASHIKVEGAFAKQNLEMVRA